MRSLHAKAGEDVTASKQRIEGVIYLGRIRGKHVG